MKPNTLQKLAASAGKDSRLILGCLSGTSMDGLDMAICRISGSGRNTRVDILHAETVEWPMNLHKRLRDIAYQQNITTPELCRLNTALGRWTGETIFRQCQTWNFPINNLNCIASHGQTVFHAPDTEKQTEHGTLQITDGDLISRITGVPVVSDFRQKHISAGGQGAPLAACADWLLYSTADNDRILINIGGIANFTFLPADGDFNKAAASDTGPGNTLMDLVMRDKTGKPFDENGATARGGKVNEGLLKNLKSHPFFEMGIPKSTGQEVFSQKFLENSSAGLNTVISTQDLMATLARFTADTIAEGIRPYCKPETEIFVSGGGAQNGFLIELLAKQMGKKVSVEDLSGIPTGFREAVLFAVLANETIAGEGFPAPDGSGNVNFGKISLPD